MEKEFFEFIKKIIGLVSLFVLNFFLIKEFFFPKWLKLSLRVEITSESGLKDRVYR